MDGTFDQLRPVHRLIRLFPNGPYYSLDLSSATDRLPVALQSHLLDLLLGKGLGSIWAVMLTHRTYYLWNKEIKEFSFLKYSVGQPMGALSSWAMLALTHHFIVQYAAWRAGFPFLFTAYAVLGDDVVIANRKVAKEYLKLLGILGVKCGIHKSIFSARGGGLEFAKRTFIDSVDVSAISWLELAASLEDLASWVGFSNKHNLKFTAQGRFLGFGYKTAKESFKRMNVALKAVYLANIAKVDLTKDTLNLGKKFPRDINLLVPEYVERVIVPLLERTLADRRRFEVTYSRAPGALGLRSQIHFMGGFTRFFNVDFLRARSGIRPNEKDLIKFGGDKLQAFDLEVVEQISNSLRRSQDQSLASSYQMAVDLL